jgi:hypothetical protein
MLGGFRTPRRPGTEVSPDDQEPFPPGISDAEDRERVLADALAHVEAQEAQYRLAVFPGPRQPLWKGALAVALFGLAGSLMACPPAALGGRSGPGVSAAERERGVRAALVIQAEQVEVFRLKHGRLPDSLSEVAVRLPGIAFVRSNSRVYQLVATRADGSALLYDSGAPATDFATLAAQWGVGRDLP